MSSDDGQLPKREVLPQTFEEIETWVMRHAKNEQEAARIRQTFLAMSNSMVRSHKAIYEAITHNNALDGPMMASILMKSFGEVMFEPYSNTPHDAPSLPLVPEEIASSNEFCDNPPPTPGRAESVEIDAVDLPKDNCGPTSSPKHFEDGMDNAGTRRVEYSDTNNEEAFENVEQQITQTEAAMIPRTPGWSFGHDDATCYEENCYMGEHTDHEDTDRSCGSSASQNSKSCSSSNSSAASSEMSTEMQIESNLAAPGDQENNKPNETVESLSQKLIARSGKRVGITVTAMETQGLHPKAAVDVADGLDRGSSMVTSDVEEQGSVVVSKSTSPSNPVAVSISEDVSELSDSDISDAETEYEIIQPVQEVALLKEIAQTIDVTVNIKRLDESFVAKFNGGKRLDNEKQGLQRTKLFNNKSVKKHRKRDNVEALDSDDLFIPVKVIKPRVKHSTEDSSDWERDRKKPYKSKYNAKSIDLGEKFSEMRRLIQKGVTESEKKSNNASKTTDSDSSEISVSSAESEYEETTVHAQKVRDSQHARKGSKKGSMPSKIVPTSKTEKSRYEDAEETDSDSSYIPSDTSSWTEDEIQPSKPTSTKKPRFYEEVFDSESEIDPSSAESEYEVMNAVKPGTSKIKPVWYKAGKQVQAPLDKTVRTFFKKTTKKIKQVVSEGIEEETFYTKERLRDPKKPAPKKRKKPSVVAKRGTGKYVCTQTVNGQKCGKRFTLKRNLDRHFVSTFAHNPINAKCAYCDVRCTSYRSIEQHTATHCVDHELGKCPFCKKMFKLQQGLYNHLVRQCPMDPSVRRLEPQNNDDTDESDD